MALPFDDVVFWTSEFHSRLAWIDGWLLAEAEFALGLAFELVDYLLKVGEILATSWC